MRNIPLSLFGLLIQKRDHWVNGSMWLQCGEEFRSVMEKNMAEQYPENMLGKPNIFLIEVGCRGFCNNFFSVYLVQLVKEKNLLRGFEICQRLHQ